MTNSPRIVAGYDGSAPSGFALDWAIAQTVLTDATLEVVHGWFPPTMVDPQGVPIRIDSATSEVDAKRLLEEGVEAALARAEHEPKRVVTTLVRRDPARALEKASEGARQVVVGSHGFGFVGRALLGSVADRAITRCHAPVTVVPNAPSLTIGDGRIVVGVEGSASSQLALRFAIGEAALRSAPLTVVHAYAETRAVVAGVVPAERGEYGRMMIKGMLDAVDPVHIHEVPAVEVLAVGGSPGETLLQIAAGATQLVVGSRGYERRPRVLGSVARRCVHHAPCPVTVVKTPVAL